MEITLGVALKGLRLPMSGALLASLAMIIALSGRHFVPRRGTILLMGGVAALLKIYSLGTVIAGPFFAILIESLIAEIFCTLFGVTRFGYFLSGAAVVSYTVLHPFLTQGLLFGGRVYEVYWATGQQLARWIHLEVAHFAVVLSLYLLVHLLIGGAAGLFAFKLAGAAQAELKKMEQSHEAV